MRKRFLIVSLITITATSWGQRSNAPEYHKKDDDSCKQYYEEVSVTNFEDLPNKDLVCIREAYDAALKSSFPNGKRLGAYIKGQNKGYLY